MRTLVLASIAAGFLAVTGLAAGTAFGAATTDGAPAVAPATPEAQIQLAHGSHTYCAQGWGRWGNWHYHQYVNGYWQTYGCQPQGGYGGGYGGSY